MNGCGEAGDIAASLAPEGGAPEKGALRYGIYIGTVRVGGCELRTETDGGLGGDVGYAIAPEHRGHGYALRACQLLLEEARKRGMRKLTIICEPGNIASRRTCEKLGCALIEIVPADRSGVRSNGRPAAVCVYEIWL